MLEELLAAKILVIRILDPTLAQNLVREIVRVLQNRQARHQAGRQRRLAGAVRINRPEPLFQKTPVNRTRQLRQRMVHVDDLIQA